MNNKKSLILLIVAIVTVGAVIYFLPKNEKEDIKKISSQKLPECLKEGRTAKYEIKKKENEVSAADIIISDKDSKQEKYRFQIELPIPDHYHPIELHKCGVYAVRNFNFNFLTRKSLTDYKLELWRYDYSGKGESLILLSNIPISGAGFGADFRIDPQEKYIALQKGYLGKDDYALVVKDLNTKQDIFTLPMESIAERYPHAVGSFGMDEWTKDSRYFWGDIFDGAYSLAYFRIDTNTWKYDIFEAVDGAMGGMPLNINTGYLPLQPGLVWTGDVDLTEDIKNRDKNEGKKSSLYLYNLFTKEKILIETTDEPQFFFQPKWLSDTELQYEMPSGKKKVYKIN